MQNLTLQQLFGANATQNSQTLTIYKLDLPVLTVSADNTAESLFVALLLKCESINSISSKVTGSKQRIYLVKRNNQNYMEALGVWRWLGGYRHRSTGEEVYNGAQFKPDTPVHRHENGVPKFKRDGYPDYQKYFSASGVESEPLFLQVNDREYWLKVKADITKRIILTEGAKKAGAALTAGECCIFIPGVSNGQRKGRLKKQLEDFCTEGRTIVLGFDSDMFHNPNVCKALDKLGCLLKTRGVLVHVLMLPRATKGIDDFIVAYGHEAFRQLVDNALTIEEWRDEFIVHATKEVKTTANAPDADENYQLKAQAALFSDRPWVSISSDLYYWTGNHYELQDKDEIKAMISRWCSAIAVPTGNGWTRTYATVTHIDNIYAWVQRHFAVAPSKVNPPSLNCLNGVVKISWQGKKPCYELVKHDPSVVYTYVSEFEFDPNASSETCDRLLECLDEPQRDIFITTMAASLDLKAIREFKGREIRALLCKGDGNNGKDSLREAVAILYGVGVVNTTVSDFQIYDGGKKFPLAKLEHARISWSSENSSFGQLDSLHTASTASKSASTETLSADSINPSSGAVAYVGSAGDTTVSNFTKNFPDSTDVSSFKVGDNCIAQHPCSIYVPNNTELTIKKIEGDKAIGLPSLVAALDVA